MEYRRCIECDDYAVARMKGPQGWRLLCLECIDRSEDEHVLDRYICSVFGCSNSPDFLILVEDDRWRALLVCMQHFRQIKPHVKSYLNLPRWLTIDEDIDLDDTGVTFEVEFNPEE